MGRRAGPGAAFERAGTGCGIQIHQLVSVGLGRGVLNRQGYYSAVLETAKENMSADKWGYWIEGKPAKPTYPEPRAR